MADHYTMDSVDLSRKRVWLGLRLPGRKMIELAAIATVRPLFRSGRFLIECYQGPPWKGLLCAAICLHQLSEQDAGGVSSDALADTRDFLKLRYRAEGLEGISAEELLDGLGSGVLPENVVPDRPDVVINYTVAALDALATDTQPATSREAFVTAVHALRDLSEATGRLLAEQQYSEEDWAEMAPLWDDAVAWRAERAT